MTSEKLDRLEALAKNALDDGTVKSSAYGQFLYEVEDPATILSLVALARVGLAVTPRPISEHNGSKDGVILLKEGGALLAKWCAGDPNDRDDDDGWLILGGRKIDKDSATHFIPLSSIPKPGAPDDKWLAAIDAAGDVEVGAGIMAAAPVAKPGGE